jgi:hypothetical protein
VTGKEDWDYVMDMIRGVLHDEADVQVVVQARLKFLKEKVIVQGRLACLEQQGYFGV